MSIEKTMEAFAANRTAIEREPLPPNVGAILDQAVARYDERPFWVSVDDGVTLSYRQFAQRVEQCSQALAGFGVERGTHVAVMLPNIPAFAITWIALARLAAVMIPINTRFTSRELEYVLSQSEAEILVIDREYWETLQGIDAATLSVPRSRTIVHGGLARDYPHDWNALLDTASPGRITDIEPDADELLTIQYTSGSTGFPKGCMLAHRYWTIIGRVRSRHSPPVQRMMLDMPFYYMGGQWRLLMALYLGATVFVARQMSMSRFLDRLIDHRIDFCSVSNALAKLPDDPRYADLGLVWVASTDLNKDLHQGFEDRVGAPIREIYGTTETGSTLSMPIEVTHMTGSGSCGLPVPYRECMIVDGQGREVPTGKTGELWVSGPGIMKGYFKRPEADAEVMRGKWFRTGDLFFKDRDGFHTIRGRIKDVIRRSGENIAASEIEAVLYEMPEILDAAAVPVADPDRGEEVKVCILLRPGLGKESLPPERIMAFCRDRLAKFKLPRYIAYLDRLPKTAKGSIAKQKLLTEGKDPRETSFDTVDGVWR
jgi:acyl-CoA synthetase (AMP-forming)/AMP-acid ligase II